MRGRFSPACATLACYRRPSCVPQARGNVGWGLGREKSNERRVGAIGWLGERWVLACKASRSPNVGPRRQTWAIAEGNTAPQPTTVTSLAKGKPTSARLGGGACSLQEATAQMQSLALTLPRPCRE